VAQLYSLTEVQRLSRIDAHRTDVMDSNAPIWTLTIIVYIPGGTKKRFSCGKTVDFGHQLSTYIDDGNVFQSQALELG